MNTLQTPKASLILKTNTLPAVGASNSVGSVDSYRTKFTFNNINLRLLLGDMYDKHDLFNLKLNNIIQSNQYIDLSYGLLIYPFGDTEEDRTIYIELEGLPFVNNSYDTLLGVNTNKAYLASYHFVLNQPQFQYDDNSILTFAKGSDKNNLTLTYKTIYDNRPPISDQVFPQMIFDFSIYGVPRDHTPERMIKDLNHRP